MGRGLTGRYSFEARRRGENGMLEELVLNKRMFASFDAAEKAFKLESFVLSRELVPLHVKRVRTVDNMLLFVAAVGAASSSSSCLVVVVRANVRTCLSVRQYDADEGRALQVEGFDSCTT